MDCKHIPNFVTFICRENAFLETVHDHYLHFFYCFYSFDLIWEVPTVKSLLENLTDGFISGALLVFMFRKFGTENRKQMEG